jgi:RNA polymerase sigma factor (TIGR02999 family)
VAELTQLLVSAREGDKKSAEQAFCLLYNDLRRMAGSRLRQSQHITLLNPTALVHESYLKFIGTENFQVEDRRHFFAYAATVMRTVIVDFARARGSEKRGAGAEHLVLDTALSEKLTGNEEDVLEVHEALQVLAQADAALAQVVEMRYFGGLTESEIADAMGLSERTVRRNWEKARLFLTAELG